MGAIIDQILIASDNPAILRQLVVWLSALSVFILVLGGAVLGINYFDPLRRRVGTLTKGKSHKEQRLVL